MPYVNGEYLTDDEVSERRAAQRGQYRDYAARERPPIRSMYQPDGIQMPERGPWREDVPTRRDIPMPEVPPGPWEPPGPEERGPWVPPTGPLERMPPPRRETGTLRPSGGAGSLLASGQRARAIAREAFAQRPQLAQSRETVRRGGRRGRPRSHPGAGGRGGFRLGDLLGGLSRVPRAIAGGMAGALPGAALGGWLGGRRS